MIRMKREAIERMSAAARLGFRPGPQGLYFIALDGTPGASGADLKAAINDSFSWMFINTDAYVLRGHIDADNTQCLALVPHVPGYRLERGESRHVFTLTLAHWAKAYGIEKALSEMRAAGQSEKADKLESAAKKAGVING